jgi:hypothetical protein
MFQFYFQSGEFLEDSSDFWAEFGKDLIIQAAGALIAAYAAVKLYYKQRKEQTDTVEQERRDRNIDNVVFLDHLVIGSTECVYSQITMYREFAESIKKSALGLPELNIQRTTVSLNRLVHKADLKELFSSYREINRQVKFDPVPRSFQTGIAVFEFLLGKIENDIDNVTRTNDQCSAATKRIASSLQAVFTESASYYAEFPADELAISIDNLKTLLNNVQSDDLSIHQKSTRKFLKTFCRC